MQTATILFVLLFGFFDPAPPDPPVITKLHYIVIHDGKKVGDINVTRTSDNGLVYYDAETRMLVKVIMKQDIYYTSKSFYQNNMLITGAAKSYLNGKAHHVCNTNWKSNHYDIKRDNDVSSISHPIYYSGSMLYFKEPAGVSVVYSEMAGIENKMSRTGDHQYTLTDSRNRKQNKYWYKSGVLDHAFIDHALLDVEIQRVNN